MDIIKIDLKLTVEEVMIATIRVSKVCYTVNVEAKIHSTRLGPKHYCRTVANPWYKDHKVNQ